MNKSQYVKTWRQRTKEKIVRVLGGRCYLCGYNKCHSALEPHHTIPSDKKFSFGGIRANPLSWNRIVEELRKCVLLCSNCHREVEDGLVNLDIITTFDESVVLEIDKTRKSTEITAVCKYCHAEFNKYQYSNIYCTDICRKQATAKKKINRKKVFWPEREELKTMLNTMTWVAIGKKYGVSDNAVRKWAKSYNLI